MSTGDAKTDEAIGLLQEWDAQNEPDSPAAAYANVLWDELAQDLFSRREHPASLSGQGRLFVVGDRLSHDPGSASCTTPTTRNESSMKIMSRGMRVRSIQKLRGAMAS